MKRISDEEIQNIRSPMSSPSNRGVYGLKEVGRAIAQAQLESDKKEHKKVVAEIKKDLDMQRIINRLSSKQQASVTVKNYRYIFGFSDEDWQAFWQKYEVD